MPKKAQSAKKYSIETNSLLTYFQKGKIDKFIISNKNKTKEVDFFEAVKIIKSKVNEKRVAIPNEYYSFIGKNKDLFDEIVYKDIYMQIGSRGGDVTQRILKRLRSRLIRFYKGFTEDDEEFLKLITKRINEGAFPKQTTKTVWSHIKDVADPIDLIRLLKRYIPKELLKDVYSQDIDNSDKKRIVILSELLIPD